ncbi:hypothetical protein AAON49_10545 [Pseudotenacibaculum sp. MALMAid0570]|uniref:hypothetical protein n=1 Tax=Pseudotenacibaculum sp. MALMAid0570 TaxID=3143938 RepID=UPI0032DF3500
MKLSEVIGKKLTNVYVKTKLRVNGMDQSDICLEIDGKTRIKFPWDFEEINLKKRKPWSSKSLKKTDFFKEIRNSVIVDFLILDDPISTGYFELSNGNVIYEQRVFPSGAMATGLIISPSIYALKEEFEEDFIRYSDQNIK